MPLLRIKLKAKRRPRWVYGVSAILSLLISGFWAWVAYSAFSFSLALARQVFIVFGVLSLLFCPLSYLANERQLRDPASKALVTTGTAFSALFASAVLYFIGKHEGEIVFTIVYGVISIGLGVYIALFAVKYEFH